MKKFKKIAASVAALATAAAMSVGTLAVSANEITKAIAAEPVYTEAEEQFIASYENVGYTDVAEFLIDNDFSLSDAENVMNLYIEGKNMEAEQTSAKKVKARKMMASGGTSNTPSFYSGENLSSKQHYGVVIVNNGSSDIRKTILNLSFDSDWVNISQSLSPRTLTSTATVDADVDTEEVDFDCKIPSTTSSNVPVGVFEFPFDVVMTQDEAPNGIFTESALRSTFGLTRTYMKLNSGSPDTTFNFETYVQGDINHDGQVNALDVSFMIEYNLGNVTLDDLRTNYTNKSANIAKIVNTLAADMNHDGEVGLADLILITDHYATE